MPIKVKDANGQEHEVPTMEEHRLLLEVVAMVGAKAHWGEEHEVWARARALAEKLRIPIADHEDGDSLGWRVITAVNPR